MKVDLNEEIRKLKDEGASLRKIATTPHISDEAVGKWETVIEWQKP